MAFISSNYLTDLEMTAQRILDRIDGLLAIVISDKDGVTVLKVAHPSVSDSSSTILTPDFLSSYSLALDQVTKLPVGEAKAVYALHGEQQIAHFVIGVYYMSFLAQANANYGIFPTLAKEFNDLHSDSVGKLISSVLESGRHPIV
ncbi:ragulator complex protein LAMTOR3-like [Symsagittifera roscoffensis]|uniref:ragulator complex protein LAMTOR3-like n=1 Tax=Symsagittifera roscoffensis TaxID=84072 RepID=UPI00307C62FB